MATQNSMKALNKIKYSVVIVTYNRCELLKEAIDCAMSQSVKPNHIVVINNASTDETRQFLESIKSPLVVVRHLKKNMGGAGGFYYGLKVARNLNDDWYVIIDDDAMLSKDFVKILLNATRKYPDIQCFAGAVKTNQKIVTDHRQNISYPGFRFKKIGQELYKRKVFTCDTASFCGIMVSRSLVDKIGYPKKNYFIWYDDTEYCVRIRKYTKILVVTSAILNHKVSNANEEWPRHYTWKDYYGMRNRLCMVKEHGSFVDVLFNRVDMWLNVYFRNKLFDIVRFHKQDWKYELSSYKRAVLDYRAIINNK